MPGAHLELSRCPAPAPRRAGPGCAARRRGHHPAAQGRVRPQRGACQAGREGVGAAAAQVGAATAARAAVSPAQSLLAAGLAGSAAQHPGPRPAAMKSRRGTGPPELGRCALPSASPGPAPQAGRRGGDTAAGGPGGGRAAGRAARGQGCSCGSQGGRRGRAAGAPRQEVRVRWVLLAAACCRELDSGALAAQGQGGAAGAVLAAPCSQLCPRPADEDHRLQLELDRSRARCQALSSQLAAAHETAGRQRRAAAGFAPSATRAARTEASGPSVCAAPDAPAPACRPAAVLRVQLEGAAAAKAGAQQHLQATQGEAQGREGRLRERCASLPRCWSLWAAWTARAAQSNLVRAASTRPPPTPAPQAGAAQRQHGRCRGGEAVSAAAGGGAAAGASGITGQGGRGCADRRRRPDGEGAAGSGRGCHTHQPRAAQGGNLPGGRSTRPLQRLLDRAMR
jgi:hypothetical protein